mgnify:CR=1 FL=1
MKEIKDEFQVMLDSKKANHEKLKDRYDTLNQLMNSKEGIIDRLNELGTRFEKTEADIKYIEYVRETATATSKGQLISE